MAEENCCDESDLGKMNILKINGGRKVRPQQLLNWEGLKLVSAREYEHKNGKR
jgi:hypothetical protein